MLTDLPGVQRPRDALTSRMQKRVETELSEADAALFVVNGDQGVGGAGDRFIAEALGRANVPIVIAVNKVDRLNHAKTVQALMRHRGARAARGRGLPDLRAHRQGRARRCSTTSRRCCPRARSTSRPRTTPTSPRT